MTTLATSGVSEIQNHPYGLNIKIKYERYSKEELNIDAMWFDSNAECYESILVPSKGIAVRSGVFC